MSQRHSLGTFPLEEATQLRDALTEEGIAATTDRLLVGDRGDKPTEWWHVYVSSKYGSRAGTFLRGWRAGRKAGR